MGRAVITSLKHRNRDTQGQQTSEYEKDPLSSSVNEDNEGQDSSSTFYSSNYHGRPSGWRRLWKSVFIFYLPATVMLEVLLVMMMNFWPTSTASEIEYTHSVMTGWVNMLGMQIMFPLLSFFIRTFIGLFMQRRFEVNLMYRLSGSAAIPVIGLSFLTTVFLGTLFAYMTKNFNLFTTLTTGFLFFSFYLSGIITTISWVFFVLERENPYEAS
jgi:hypothetical protein